MAPKRARKPTAKASSQADHPTITLGTEQEPNPLIIYPSIEALDNTSFPPTSLPIESSYPLEPLLQPTDTQDANTTRSAIQNLSRESSAEDEDDNRLT